MSKTMIELLKDRIQQIQNGESGRESGRCKFRYTFADLDCRYCLEKDDCQSDRLCPYIFDNLPDLMLDPNFMQAVENAESCKTHHKETLLCVHLNTRHQGVS